MTDAIVIGSGPNGLVAANMLADDGWTVLVVEAHSEPGGGARSGELIEPGYVNDHCSAFHPLGAASPVFKSLELERYGLRWKQAPLVLAHPALDGSCPVISQDINETAKSLGADGDAWRRLQALWDEVGDDLLATLFTPFPPVRPMMHLAHKLAWKDLLRLARMSLLPVRRMGEEHFATEEAKRLLAGLALHADLLPESPLSGFLGWILGAVGQDLGFPSPEGGTGSLTTALIRRLEERGGAVRCNARVAKVAVRRGRAVGVELADGDKLSARRAVLADVDAPTLYLKLLPRDVVPNDVLDDIKRFQWDNATVKVDWNLDAPVPWDASDARRAGTLHIAESVDELSVSASELARGIVPTNPFMLFGQQSMIDLTRQPEGKETAWAYTHIPQTTRWTESELTTFVDRMQARVEALAPGFGGLVHGRRVNGPDKFERENSNLRRGAVTGGTAQLHQQFVFRPIAGLARPETPIRHLYLASAAAHPGGGVHGGPGANAARAAMHGALKRTFVRAVRSAGTVQGRGKAQIVP